MKPNHILYLMIFKPYKIRHEYNLLSKIGQSHMRYKWCLFARQTEDQKKLRENMKTAARGEDFDKLDNLINEFRKQKLEDKGDLQVALERLQFLRLQKSEYIKSQSIMVFVSKMKVKKNGLEWIDA